MIDRIDTAPEPKPSANNSEPPTMVLSAPDLARELRVSTKTIDRMDQMGKLPRPIRVGHRAKRWPRDVIVRWIAAGAPNRRDWERMGC